MSPNVKKKALDGILERLRVNGEMTEGDIVSETELIEGMTENRILDYLKLLKQNNLVIETNGRYKLV